MTRYASVLIALFALFAAACGATDGAGDDDGGGVDAGASGCDMSISFAPAMPVAPVTMVVNGAVDKHGDTFGVERYEWTVDRDDVPVSFTPRDTDSRSIEFLASEPGPYVIQLAGDVGGTGCASTSASINVRDPASLDTTYRLKLIPPGGIQAPPQVQTITVPTLADFDLQDVVLASGTPVAGTVQGEGGGGLAGYVRLTPVGDPALSTPTEIFAAADGTYAARVSPGTYDVLVVPADGTVAPSRFTGLTAAALDAVLTLTTGDVITGSVLASDGTPISGARVSIAIDSVPSTLATTAGDGTFSLRARVGGATAVSVTVPDGSLPRLELPASAGLVAAVGEPIVVRYAASVAARTETFTVLDTDGSTAVPDASLAFVARPVVASGTVTGGGGPLAADGHARVMATADAGGNTGAVSLPPAIYDVILAPPSGAATTGDTTLRTLDLTAGPAPAQLALAPLATARGSFGENVAATVTAVPVGPLALAAAPTVQVQAGMGTFQLSLVGGGAYEIVVRPAAGQVRARAMVRVPVVAPAAGETATLPTFALPVARMLTGVVKSPLVAGGVSGVTVSLLCADCTGAAASTPLSEAVSREDGSFEMSFADPAPTKD